jgi:hypothetical protein
MMSDDRKLLDGARSSLVARRVSVLHPRNFEH